MTAYHTAHRGCEACYVDVNDHTASESDRTFERLYLEMGVVKCRPVGGQTLTHSHTNIHKNKNLATRTPERVV